MHGCAVVGIWNRMVRTKFRINQSKGHFFQLSQVYFLISPHILENRLKLIAKEKAYVLFIKLYYLQQRFIILK